MPFIAFNLVMRKDLQSRLLNMGVCFQGRLMTSLGWGWVAVAENRFTSKPKSFLPEVRGMDFLTTSSRS